MLGDSINDVLFAALYLSVTAELMNSVAVTYYQLPTPAPDPLFEFFTMPRPGLDVDLGIARRGNVR